MVSGTGSGTTRPGCDLTILGQVSVRHCLHLGQDECELSHLSMQGTWKPWLHFGKSRTLSSLANSERHITHSVSKLGRSNFLEWECPRSSWTKCEVKEVEAYIYFSIMYTKMPMNSNGPLLPHEIV
ncbi:hypothetical protein Lal_00023935 [Lupinus albus]|nr:hypothetical protein Lal_00023935 [Lupinus albus]